MFRNKLLTIARLANPVVNQNVKKLIHTSVPRQGGGGGEEFFYRTFGQPQRISVIGATCLGTFFWWWVFWHLFTDYGHIIGHLPYEDPSTWTDEELGIPPDDAEDP